jgi:hypothetical protein
MKNGRFFIRKQMKLTDSTIAGRIAAMMSCTVLSRFMGMETLHNPYRGDGEK